MHELSYMLRLCDAALSELKKHPGKKALSISVEVGELTGVLPYYLDKYYPKAAKGTPLEDASLKIIEIPAEACCDGCGLHYHPSKEADYKCPNCGGISAHFIHGRELCLKEIRLAE